LPVDANGACAEGIGALLLIPHKEYPKFTEGGAY
jgi:hypothetical protein